MPLKDVSGHSSSYKVKIRTFRSSLVVVVKTFRSCLQHKILNGSVSWLADLNLRDAHSIL